MDNNYETINIVSKNGNRKNFIYGIILGMLIGAAITSGVYVLSSVLTMQRTGNKARVNEEKDLDNVLDEDTLKKAQNIQKVIDSQFYDYDGDGEDISKDRIEEGIFRGIVSSLGDKYADYYSASDMEEVMNDYEGVSYGIGCYVTINDDGMPEIYGVFEGSPAESAGVENGDVIMQVDGASVAGLSLSAVVELIKGKENTEVSIDFKRKDEIVNLVITRGKLIEDTSVVSGLLIDNEDIGYIRIKEFSDTTVNQFKEALDGLREEDIKGLVLDLRSNPGGNLSAVVDISRYLLPEGIVVYTEDSKGVRKNYTSDGSHEIDLPLVVLVNNYSASASEILSGAIQDYNKGTLIGTKTYGKGIVQSLLNVGDGSVVKITTSAYFTPAGRNIQGSGITPDIEIEYDKELAEKDGTDNQVNKAVEVLRQKIGE